MTYICIHLYLFCVTIIVWFLACVGKEAAENFDYKQFGAGLNNFEKGEEKVFIKNE